MTERKWTPGPWKAIFDHPTNACANVELAEGYTSIATCFGGDSDSAQDDDGNWSDQPIRDANARLIAAAPDLYEALDYCLAFMMADCSCPNATPEKVAAISALAKARGEA